MSSMFKGKVGFVIPKNKFSGSLVPIFNKSESNDTSPEQNNKQQQRKTRWGADLTQDTTVKRGRALAYQTRVDQITQQLKLGSLNSKSAGDVADTELTDMQVKLEKLQGLELERREAIGEILKLNPSYKAPSDYEPVLRETNVPIPVKAHPEFNFLGLLYGSDGDTLKRLEKDTGTTIQVYGSKIETGEKVEIMASSGTDVLITCGEVYVQISADAYEKVDAAADIIEMLINSVLVKPADSSGAATVSKEITLDVASARSQEMPVIGPMFSFSQDPFHPYQTSWFPGGQSSSPSGPMPFNPSSQRPLFGPGPPVQYGFVSSSQNSIAMSPRLHSPALAVQGSSLSLAYPFGQNVPPSSLTSATSRLVGQQSNFANSPRLAAPLLAERPLIVAASSPGWPAPVSGGPQSLSLVPTPSVTPLRFPSSQVGPASATSFLPAQIRSSSALPLQSFAPQAQSFVPQGQLNLSANSVSRPLQFPVPPPSVPPLPQSGMASPGHGYGPSFTPLNQMGAPATRPPLRVSGDFTFQPHRSQGSPSHAFPRPGMHFTSQRPTEAQLPHEPRMPSFRPPEPQMPSFRPAMQSTIQPGGQNFSRPPIGNQMGPPPGHFGGPNLNINMGPRNHSPVPQFPNAVGPLPPRSGPTAHFQQSQPPPGGNFGGNTQPGPFGRRQVYDPFRPSSLSAQHQGSNIAVSRKQDSDPEYEDLMASVGVK